MIDKLQQLKGISKLNFYQNISIYCDEIGYRRSSITPHLKKILLLKMLKV